LVYGAGVIGSIFAGMIARKGYDITVLARGKRLQELNDNGLILVNAINKKRITVLRRRSRRRTTILLFTKYCRHSVGIP